jgi:hypothetical protein
VKRKPIQTLEREPPGGRLDFWPLPAENDGMVIRGRIQNGVVVLDADAPLPEGAEVSVVFPPAPEAASETMSEAERQRVLQIMDRIAALPIEGMTDPFSGADHDKVLYGRP